MDILLYLLKATLAGEVENENWEFTRCSQDVALCEFICSSKIEIRILHNKD